MVRLRGWLSVPGQASRKLAKTIRADLFLKKSPDGEEDPLSQHLQWWIKILDMDQLPGLRYTVLVWLRQSWLAFALSFLVMVQWAFDTVCTGEMFGLRVAMSEYSSLAVMLIFRWRRHLIKSAINDILHVCAVVAERGQLEAQERMAASATFCAKLVRFYEVYAYVCETVVVAAIFFNKYGWHHVVSRTVLLPFGFNPNGEVESALASFLRWAMVPAQSMAGACCVVGSYSVVVLIMVIYLSMTDLMFAIGLSVETEPRGSKLWAQQQSVVTLATLKLDEALADLMPHVLVVSVVVPLLCTVEVALNPLNADPFAVGLAPLVLVVFVPFCLVGDSMNAAREDVSLQVYSGPWLEEPPKARMLHLGMMQCAGGLGGALRGKGIGRLDRDTCGNALKNWFSFLQVLMNLQ